jgi:hemolysin activation/secretion protein
MVDSGDREPALLMNDGLAVLGMARRPIIRLGLIATAVWLVFCASASAQGAPVPAPSQVQPPSIAPPTGGGHISIPQVPAGAQIPPEAKKLSFKLVGFDIRGEFEMLVAQRKQLEAPLIGKRITVAQVFEFADQLQQIYAKAGYPLARVVLLPQEFEGATRIKLRVIDGFVERFELGALPWQVQHRVAAVLAPLQNKTRLQQSELERRLLIAGEAPGLVLNAAFAPGKQVGGSVLVLSGRYRAVSLSVYGDNDMPVVFGTGQGVVTASANSWLGIGDQLTVTTAGLPDKDFVSEFPTRRYMGGNYSLPLGIDGWKFEVGGTDGITTPRVDPLVATKGVYNEGYAKLSYELLKRRDYELTVNERLDATNETIETLAIQPPVPISEDRTRVLRTGADGIWRLRENGITVIYGANYSRGLDALGARSINDATPLLPLSRQDADAVFNKLDGHIEIDQALQHDFFDNFYAAGQDSFHRALLTSEQYGIDGAKLLSGFTAGALPGDTAWMVRNEFGRTITTQLPTGSVYSGVVWSPYLFAATGERILEDPTVLEIASVHATNYGVGMRYNFLPAFDPVPNAYGFVEWSRRYTNETVLNGDRIFAGFLLQY